MHESLGTCCSHQILGKLHVSRRISGESTVHLKLTAALDRAEQAKRSSVCVLVLHQFAYSVWHQLFVSQVLAADRQGNPLCTTDFDPKAVLGFQSSKNIWQITMLEN